MYKLSLLQMENMPKPFITYAVRNATTLELTPILLWKFRTFVQDRVSIWALSQLFPDQMDHIWLMDTTDKITLTAAKRCFENNFVFVLFGSVFQVFKAVIITHRQFVTQVMRSNREGSEGTRKK